MSAVTWDDLATTRYESRWLRGSYRYAEEPAGGIWLDVEPKPKRYGYRLIKGRDAARMLSIVLPGLRFAGSQVWDSGEARLDLDSAVEWLRDALRRANIEAVPEEFSRLRGMFRHLRAAADDPHPRITSHFRSLLCQWPVDSSLADEVATEREARRTQRRSGAGSVRRERRVASEVEQRGEGVAILVGLVGRRVMDDVEDRRVVVPTSDVTDLLTGADAFDTLDELEVDDHPLRDRRSGRVLMREARRAVVSAFGPERRRVVAGNRVLTLVVATRGPERAAAEKRLTTALVEAAAEAMTRYDEQMTEKKVALIADIAATVERTREEWSA